MRAITLLGFVVAIVVTTEATGKYKGLEFIDSCSKRDPELEACLTRAFNAFAGQLRYGLPQLGYPEVEPIILDELHISLDDRPEGYKAQFTNITARGVSAVRVTQVRSRISDDEVQLQLTLSIPKIRAAAQYRSSGTLILVQASGGGDYWGDYDGVKAKVFIRAKPYLVQGQQFLRLQQLKIDFSVRDIKMGIENVHNGNTVLQAVLNLFINNNSQELLKEMKPDLRRKLVQLMSTFAEKIFAQVPYDAFVTD